MTHTLTDEEYEEYQRLKERGWSLGISDLDRGQAQQARALSEGPRYATPPFSNPVEGDQYVDTNNDLRVFAGGGWMTAERDPRLWPRQHEQCPPRDRFVLPPAERTPFQEAINKHVSERLAYIAEHRERLLEAWIAQYGFSPAETALVTESRPEGVECTYVRRTGDSAELERFREREPKLQAALDRMAPTNPDLDQFRAGSQTQSTSVRVSADRLAFIEQHKDRLIEGWIAQHGYPPDGMMLVTEFMPNGGPVCSFVQRAAENAELEAFRKREALVKRWLDAWDSRHGMMRGVSEVGRGYDRSYRYSRRSNDERVGKG